MIPRIGKRLVILVVLLALGGSGSWVWAGDKFFTEAGVGGGVMCDVDLPGDRLWGASVVGQLARRLWENEGVGVDLRLEGVGTWYWGKDTAVLGGVTVGLRAYTRLRPPAVFIEGAIGPSWNTLDIEEIGSSFNFLTYGGVGARVGLKGEEKLDIALRIRHISNAGMTDRNHGLTSVWVMVSWCWSL